MRKSAPDLAPQAARFKDEVRLPRPLRLSLAISMVRSVLMFGGRNAAIVLGAILALPSPYLLTVVTRMAYDAKEDPANQ